MFACNSYEGDIQVNLYELLEHGGSFLDTTISKKQKQAYKKLAETVSANLKFQDDRIVFMDKDEFLSKGFSEMLYNQFEESIASVNIAIAKDSLILNEFKKKLPDKMAELQEKVINW
jgi:hypothetical protein